VAASGAVDFPVAEAAEAVAASEDSAGAVLAAAAPAVVGNFLELLTFSS
jgi:hypothetical protein